MTCLGFSETKNFLFFLVTATFFSNLSFAETPQVISTSGRDLSEAFDNVLKITVSKFLQDKPEFYRPILQNEILSTTNSFIQSYKITDKRSDGAVSVSAVVDLDVIRGLFSFAPKAFGEEAQRVLIIVKGEPVPDDKKTKNKKLEGNPYSVLDDLVKERMARRKFEPIFLDNVEITGLGFSEDTLSTELMRGLGSKYAARLVVGIVSHFESVENENSHSMEDRVVTQSVILDMKSGNILAKATGNIAAPKGPRDQYVSDLRRSLFEEGKSLLLDMMINAGKKFLGGQNSAERSFVRVLLPGNAGLVAKFRALLEAAPGVKGIQEWSLQRGKYDFMIKPAISKEKLTSLIQGIKSDDIAVEISQDPISESDQVILPIYLMAKEHPKPPETKGGENAKH